MENGIYAKELMKICLNAKIMTFGYCVAIFEKEKRPLKIVDNFGKIILRQSDLVGTDYYLYELIEFHYFYDMHHLEVYYKDTDNVVKNYVCDSNVDVIYKADMLHNLYDILMQKQILTKS